LASGTGVFTARRLARGRSSVPWGYVDCTDMAQLWVTVKQTCFVFIKVTTIEVFS
jgi:hypothetical protein